MRAKCRITLLCSINHSRSIKTVHEHFPKYCLKLTKKKINLKETHNQSCQINVMSYKVQYFLLKRSLKLYLSTALELMC